MDDTFIARHLGTPPRSSVFVDLADQVLRKTIPWIKITSTWRGRMASIEFRMNLFHLLSQVIAYRVPGQIIEVGCHAGESTVVMQQVIQDMDPGRELHVFDSFQGVPAGGPADEGVYSTGDMTAGQEEFDKNFNRVKLPKPHKHPGWFEDTLPKHLPDQIAFSLLDADLYSSTLVALKAIYPKISPGGICMFGVYWDPTIGAAATSDRRYKSPGVKKACDEFFADKPERVSVLLAGNYTSGYIRKQ